MMNKSEHNKCCNIAQIKSSYLHSICALNHKISKDICPNIKTLQTTKTAFCFIIFWYRFKLVSMPKARKF